MGDDELLDTLISRSKNDSLIYKLSNSLLSRTFYEDFFEFTRAEAESAEEGNVLNIIEDSFHKNCANRVAQETD